MTEMCVCVCVGGVLDSNFYLYFFCKAKYDCNMCVCVSCFLTVFYLYFFCKAKYDCNMCVCVSGVWCVCVCGFLTVFLFVFFL